MIKEINLAVIQSNNKSLNTLYFGGGTPSILDMDDLKRIFDALQKKFVFDEDIEITLEANPDDINSKKLHDWKSIGINRFSIGIQSFYDDELQWMNRAHNSTDAVACIDLIKDAGFENFSVDLIYGSPLLSDGRWKKNVELVVGKKVPHISCYALTVEPRTALDKMIFLKKKQSVDSEKQASQFLLLMDWLSQAGYEHYEISNFAIPGFRSKHNSSYWQGKHYHGFGPSAHSFDGKSRRWNIANNALYIQSLEKNIISFEEEKLTTTQQLNEYIMTSLRTIEGLNLDFVEKKFGEKESQQLLNQSKKWDSKIKLIDSKIMLTNEGKLFADGIAADLFFDKSS